MSDLHDTIETLLLRAALMLLFGLIAWAAAVVGIGLVTSAARAVIEAPALTWADENTAMLAFFVATLGYGWLRLRPAIRG